MIIQYKVRQVKLNEYNIIRNFPSFNWIVKRVNEIIMNRQILIFNKNG